MHTEEFVLIPKQMYTRKQPHVSQLLSNKNIHNPAKQISLLQRNKSPSAPSASQQDTEQQTDASVDDRSTINESMAKSFTTDNTSTIKKGVLNDIKILKGIKFERANTILDIIEESDSVSLDSSNRFLINGTNTEVLAATFLYNLQKTTCKLSFEQFSVLTHLDIVSHLTCNTYAKKFLYLSSEERLQFLEYESDKEFASKSLRKKTKASATTTRETLKRQKKKSSQSAPGRITSYQVKQLDKLYTKGSAAFGSIANLKKASGFTRGKIVRYLQSNAPYTKYRQFRESFPRLKAVAYRINEIWSVNVAYMDKNAQHNNGVKNIC